MTPPDEYDDARGEQRKQEMTEVDRHQLHADLSETPEKTRRERIFEQKMRKNRAFSQISD
jgi:hypothetical protein